MFGEEKAHGWHDDFIYQLPTGKVIGMTSKQILDAISQLTDVQRLEWLINLGWEMTVSARAGYPNSSLVNDKMSYLIAFNEIQHQIYNFMRHSSAEGDWKIEDFFEGLHRKAAASGVDVEGYFGTAVKSSLRNVRR